MSDNPMHTCLVCGERELVVPDGRGFPPDIAKRKLAKRCKVAGHTCDPRYTCGFAIDPSVRGMTDE